MEEYAPITKYKISGFNLYHLRIVFGTDRERVWWEAFKNRLYVDEEHELDAIAINWRRSRCAYSFRRDGECGWLVTPTRYVGINAAGPLLIPLGPDREKVKVTYAVGRLEEYRTMPPVATGAASITTFFLTRRRGVIPTLFAATVMGVSTALVTTRHDQENQPKYYEMFHHLYDEMFKIVEP